MILFCLTHRRPYESICVYHQNGDFDAFGVDHGKDFIEHAEEQRLLFGQRDGFDGHIDRGAGGVFTGLSGGEQVINLPAEGGAVDPLTFEPSPPKEGEALVTCARLNVRDAPGFDGRVIGALVYGDVVETAGDPVEDDGIIWRPARVWVADKYLNVG